MEEILANLAAHYGLPSMSLDGDAATAVEFDDGLYMTIGFLASAEQPRMLVCIELPPLPVGGVSEALALLSLNGRLFDAQGASFALDAATQNVLVLRVLEGASLSGPVLPLLMDALVFNARHWRNKLLRSDLDLGLEAPLELALDSVGAS